MGAYSPAAVLTPELQARVMREIIEPTLAGMKARGTPYTGILYAGLMLTKDGPQLIEYNARLGDPETQVLLPRLRSDLVIALLAACDGMLNSISLQWSDAAALTVVMAANGYPGAVEKGSEIKGIGRAEELNDVIVFHAGTKQEGDRILANGGRVLNVTALGVTITEAQKKAYEAVDRINWPVGFCRRDIGWRAVEREQG
jgi:phosphoribosylamine--glycine ligase